MPYSTKLITNRKNAATCGSHLRKIASQVRAQEDMDPMHRARVLNAIHELSFLLYAVVDYNDEGTLMGIAGEYEGTLFGQNCERVKQVLEQRNAQLYQVGLAAIELYRAKNPADAWLQKASVLGLSEVRVENAAEEMRTKLDDARYFAPAPALAATAAGPR